MGGRREPAKPRRKVRRKPLDGPPSVRAPAFKAGAMVDHYRVMRLLGRGGMGEVYLARDRALGRKVALKIVRSERLVSPKARQRFLFEAQTTAKFRHPNIVAIYGVGETAGRSYVALEYIEGQNLRQRMLEQVMSQQEALRIALAIAEALQEAHRHGVLHRDLKPANVVIARDGRPRVLDFGLATTITHEQELFVNSNNLGSWGDEPSFHDGGTEDGEEQPAPPSGGGGTPAYMAPEQWRKLECTTKTDIWALGALLFKMLSDRLPFDEATAPDHDTVATMVDGERVEQSPSTTSLAPMNVHERIARRRAVVCGPAPASPLDSVVPNIPQELAALVASCLEKAPTARPEVGEVIDKLRELLHAGRKRPNEIRSPFRGLLPFAERHADLFFGRDAETAAFVERLRRHAVLPVVGPSGVGKSSFIQAGVIPRLREQDSWAVLQMRPGARPFEALATALLRGDQDSASESRVDASSESSSLDSSAISEDIGALADELRRQPRKLALQLRRLAESQQQMVLLFVDQLEELFTQVESKELRQRFVQTICFAADEALDPVRVVFTIRDDFLGRLAIGPEAREVLSQVTVIQTLGPAALVDTLVTPAEALGYQFEDAELPQQMTEAVAGARAGLPLLQFAAQVLWEQRDRQRRLLLRSVYERMDGVAGALAKHADSVLDAMTPSEHKLTRLLLLRLVTAERTRKASTRAQALDGLPEGSSQILDKLIKSRLLSVIRSREKGSSGARIELAHESLIHSWHTLSRWVDESREDLVFLAEIEQAVVLWDQRGRHPEELWQGAALAEALRKRDRLGAGPASGASKATEGASRAGQASLTPLAADFLEQANLREQRRRRRKRAIVATVIGSLSLVAVVLGVQKVEADHQRTRAEHQRVRAEHQRAVAEQRRAESLREGGLAAFNRGHMLEARAKLRAALEIEDAQSARALWWQLDGEPLRWSKTLGGIPYHASFGVWTPS